MKTIRQIADEIGVSKQAVFKKIKREPLSTSLQGLTAAVDGLVDGASTKNAEKTTGVDGVISVLQATIDTLQGQLEVKDRQIEQQAQTITRLTDALAAAQQTAVAAQALHAGTIQQQLVAGEGEELQQERETVPRRSWWKRLFEGKDS